MTDEAGLSVPSLQVDGGASANDLLCQLQADQLGVPVQRPQVRETTALGAAFLAGLGTGVWSSPAELADVWQLDRRFEPTAGVRDDGAYLCCVDLYGNQYQTHQLTTGIARMLCPPIIDASFQPDMPVEEAKALMLRCFQALYARYSLAEREVVLCTVSSSGIQEERVRIDIPYNYRGYINKEDIM